MILSGKEILKEIDKNIIIKPFNKNKINPNSYNLKLGNKLLVYKNDILDLRIDNIFEEIIIPENGLMLLPGKLYLGKTVEYTETFNYVPMLEGRSSLGRLGLFVHICAGFGDVGFCGYWTLEISCIQSVIIYPNIDICQIYYHRISRNHKNYCGKYQNNQNIQTSMMYKDFEKNEK